MDIRDLGTLGYLEALEYQKALLEKRIKGEVKDTLIMVEHPKVVTLGRTSSESSILDKTFFEENDIPVIMTGRGGEITYHSPGQLVLYPVIDLGGKERDVSLFIDFLERTISGSLKELGIPAERVPDKRGVWLEGEKIGFIGIALKRWVTYHGVAININNDITPFLYMDPCGEKGTKVTSVKQYLGHEVDISRAKNVLGERFSRDLCEEYIKTPAFSA